MDTSSSFGGKTQGKVDELADAVCASDPSSSFVDKTEEGTDTVDTVLSSEDEDTEDDDGDLGWDLGWDRQEDSEREDEEEDTNEDTDDGERGGQEDGILQCREEGVINLQLFFHPIYDWPLVKL